jgi:heme/copper-type cytochrome/quinol oxidase subunit 3
MRLGPVERKHFVDVNVNAVYWYFVVLAWLPIYIILYFGPHLL